MWWKRTVSVELKKKRSFNAGWKVESEGSSKHFDNNTSCPAEIVATVLIG